jgi:hypothetical protein
LDFSVRLSVPRSRSSFDLDVYCHQKLVEAEMLEAHAATV